MPTPNTDGAIAALRAPWFFKESKSRTTGKAQGENYATKLTDKFGTRTDKAAIETAIGKVGGMAVTDSGKHKKAALRALVLAEVLMRNRPATQIEGMSARYQSLAFDALKRAVINQFPISQGHHRPFWGPGYFSDPILLPDLRTQQDWTGKPIPEYKFIVHVNGDTSAALWNNPVAELAKYSGSSCTVMSNEKPYAYPAGVQGVIFRVPANNVLLTYQADLMTTLHAKPVSDLNRTGHTLAEEILELAAASESGTGGLETPTALLRKTNPPMGTPLVGLAHSKYNEVVVCGKPRVPLPWGATGELKLVGLFMFMTKTGTLLQAYDAPARLQAMEAHAKRLKRPLLFLPNAP